MNMTHYMQLLAENQPWNLILFMAIPVICAETLAISELYLLFTRKFDSRVRALNRVTGVFVGLYFIGIILYLLPNAVIPLTRSGEWRSWVDMLAVGAYLLSGLPMILIAGLELGLISRQGNPQHKLKLHAICVAAFLVLAHVAMIFGMLNPDLFITAPVHQMATMPGMSE